MKTHDEIKAALKGTPFEKRTIHSVDQSQLNKAILIVIFTDGTQTNVPAKG